MNDAEDDLTNPTDQARVHASKDVMSEQGLILVLLKHQSLSTQLDDLLNQQREIDRQMVRVRDQLRGIRQTLAKHTQALEQSEAVLIDGWVHYVGLVGSAFGGVAEVYPQIIKPIVAAAS